MIFNCSFYLFHSVFYLIHIGLFLFHCGFYLIHSSIFSFHSVLYFHFTLFFIYFTASFIYFMASFIYFMLSFWPVNQLEQAGLRVESALDSSRPEQQIHLRAAAPPFLNPSKYIISLLICIWTLSVTIAWRSKVMAYLTVCTP